jgi:hypothetical protein
MATVLDSSTSTVISWPRVSMLLSRYMSSWGMNSPLWLPGSTLMQPLSGVAGESASQTVIRSSVSSPQ